MIPCHATTTVSNEMEQEGSLRCRDKKTNLVSPHHIHNHVNDIYLIYDHLLQWLGDQTLNEEISGVLTGYESCGFSLN